jgi:hypothetical protein
MNAGTDFRNSLLLRFRNQETGWNRMFFPPVLSGVARVQIFKPKNPNLGKFWRVLQWKMFGYVMAIWPILQSFGIFCCHLVYFMVIWYIFHIFGML